MSALKFGKYKGQEPRDVARTKEGRGWLAWWLAQPQDPKYAASNLSLIKEAREALALYQGAEATHSVIVAPTAPTSDFKPKVWDDDVIGEIQDKLDQILSVCEDIADKQNG